MLRPPSGPSLVTNQTLVSMHPDAFIVPGEEWGIHTPRTLEKRCRELGAGASLIERLIPQESLSIIVGDSGVGKSPFLYQAAISVAAGLAFLGHKTSKGPVLYLDFENGLGQVNALTQVLAKHLGMPKPPEDLLMWNFNDVPSGWKPDDLKNMIVAAEPSWVIIDSLSAFAPEIEEKSSFVTRIFQGFRNMIREAGITMTVVHHLKKPSQKPDEAAPPLEENPHGWLLQARGSRALINASDVRIGIARPTRAGAGEIALVLNGFGRLGGNLPVTYVSRVLDEEGEPLGYEKLTGPRLLFNAEQEMAYNRLPKITRFMEAQRIYGKQSQATKDFLQKCLNVGIIRKDGREYRKVELP